VTTPASPPGARAAAQPPRIVVLGIGNVLWADEGFGVRCVEALQQRWEFAPQVELVDGGTQGLYLIDVVARADHLLIFDAIDYGLPPGRIELIEDEAVPRYLGARKMSLHQTGFQDVLCLAQLAGHYPERVLLVGCQPEELDDYGGSLRPSVRTALEDALALAVARLRDWGGAPRARLQPCADDARVNAATLALEHYEGQRPDETQACRWGDERFLALRA